MVALEVILTEETPWVVSCLPPPPDDGAVPRLLVDAHPSNESEPALEIDGTQPDQPITAAYPVSIII
jgi:hypothetical protein